MIWGCTTYAESRSQSGFGPLGRTFNFRPLTASNCGDFPKTVIIGRAEIPESLGCCVATLPLLFYIHSRDRGVPTCDPTRILLGIWGGQVFLTMLKTKLHRATVTGADMHYEGSIGIDRDLLDASGILPHEQVDVLNINTGARFTTYAIEAPRGSSEIAVNGAAARLVQKGDKVIIVAYCQLPAEEARNYHPSVVLLGDDNEIVSKS